jgi:hypothetical protein
MTTFRADPTSASVVVKMAVDSAAARRARLDRLKQALTDYATAEKKRIEAEVSTLQDILDGRTGGQGLSKYPAQDASRFAYDSMAEFLAGTPLDPLIEVPLDQYQHPTLPSPVFVATAYSAPTLASGSAPAAPQNYNSRRKTQIDMVVIHVMQGNTAGAVQRFQDPGARVSAHYCISQSGKLTSCVAESMNAWHAGNGEVNRRSIGIECEGFIDDQTMWTDELMTSLIGLVKDICDRYGIPKTRAHIIGHVEVPGATHTDPGEYAPWSRIMAGLSNAVVA